MMLGVPKPILAMDTLTLSDSIKGTPVCRGKYKGVAKVVTRLSDAKCIEQGDILITVSTDIGWSPYFPLLGGVVTELGGLISHGAVVAREYGLPCVVGAEGATTAFKSGNLLQNIIHRWPTKFWFGKITEFRLLPKFFKRYKKGYFSMISCLG